MPPFNVEPHSCACLWVSIEPKLCRPGLARLHEASLHQLAHETMKLPAERDARAEAIPQS